MIVVYTCIYLLALVTGGANADTRPVQELVYQTSEVFLANAFQGEAPDRQRVWVRGELKNELTRALGHAPKWLRISYWAQGTRSAWILEEIGKEQPITTGVVIADGKVEQVRVLVYRESRGAQVRYPFFTKQFRGVALNERKQLDQKIDGITGATLSVRALERMAKAALLLHSHSINPKIILAQQ